jgi:phosphinothricin acetyltransferase
LSSKGVSLILRDMTTADGPAVLEIYGQGIAAGHATFQDRVPDWTAWDRSHLPKPRRVLAEGDKVLAWAALSPVSSREVYAGVAEVSLYVAGDSRGGGLGKRLLSDLVERSEEIGIWTLQAGIFPENEASISLHRRCGFRTVGRREKLGLMRHGPLAGKWRDVVLLERRSSKT